MANKNPDRYDLDNIGEINLDNLTEPDFMWNESFSVTTYPYQQNYFEIGAKVVGPMGDIGVIVGVEYLGRVRKPIYWVKYENSPYPQPELGDVLMPAEVSGEFTFKRILSSVSVHPRETALEIVGLPSDVVITPESYGWISEVGFGGLFVHALKGREVKTASLDDIEVKDVLPLAISLRIPVKVVWAEEIVSPTIAYNMARELGLI